ncbi:MAG: 8-oxo-dGTP diphosphatase [Patescibacteria group bacterium]|nr:8-oxo-dGTP diphosphatase [Patescibacteria group bacterium]
MRDVTLCFLVRGNKICLAMKKRGFGVGKWNGVGGKVQDGETIEEAAVRELREEIGVTTLVEDLENVGNIKFFFNEKPDWNQRMYIYFVHRWTGNPQESDEMAPKWYKLDEIPYDAMWVDDPHWLPNVLRGEKIEGEFYFNQDGAELDKFNVKGLVAK